MKEGPFSRWFSLVRRIRRTRRIQSAGTPRVTGPFCVVVALSLASNPSPVLAQPPLDESGSALQQIKLTISDPPGDRVEAFGGSLSISGDTAIVAAGEPDATYVFERTDDESGDWVEVARLDPGVECNGPVAISGDIAIVGCPEPMTNRGSAFIFVRNQGGPDAWGPVAQLRPREGVSNDQFGATVAIDGDTVVVGAWRDALTTAGPGAAYVFTRNQGGLNAWGQVVKLTASDADESDLFGWSVAVSGETVIVGAQNDEDRAISAGSAYLFSRDHGGTNAWGQIAKLTASDAAVNDRFGWSVSISGGTALVGAFQDSIDGLTNAGSAYVFVRAPGQVSAWREVAKLTASDAQSGDRFGGSVTINGDTAVVGVPEKRVDSGVAYVFSRDRGGPDAWGEIARVTALDGAIGDDFGAAVSVSSNTIIIGAPQIGNAQAGSAYVCQLDAVAFLDGCRRTDEPVVTVDRSIDMTEVSTSCCVDSEFLITATFRNGTQSTIPRLVFHRPFIEVVELTGGNVLKNADEGPGGVGTRLTLDVGDDRALTSGESVTVTFVIGLESRSRFEFLVHVKADPEAIFSASAP